VGANPTQNQKGKRKIPDALSSWGEKAGETKKKRYNPNRDRIKLERVGKEKGLGG